MEFTGWVNAVTPSLQLVQLQALGWGWAGLTKQRGAFRVSPEAVSSLPTPLSLHSWGAS